MVDEPYVQEWSNTASAIRRFTATYSDMLRDVYRREIRMRSGQASIERALGAWPLLVYMAERGHQWALDHAEGAWPGTQGARYIVLQYLMERAVGGHWIERKLLEVMPHMSPAEVRDLLIDAGRRRPGPVTPAVDAIYNLLTGRNESEARLVLDGEEQRGVHVRLTTITERKVEGANGYAALTDLKCRHPGWLPLLHSEEFLSNPNGETLASVLKKCADGGWTSDRSNLARGVPWPIAACLASAKNAADLEALATIASRGEMGSVEDWVKAERRWMSVGVSLDEVCDVAICGKPFDASIRVRGIPTAVVSVSVMHREYSRGELRQLLRGCERLAGKASVQDLGWCFFKAAEINGGVAKFVGADELLKICRACGFENVWPGDLGDPTGLQHFDEWAEFWDWLGRSKSLSPYWLGGGEHAEAWARIWEDAFIRDPSKSGLLRLLGRAASVSEDISRIPAPMLDLGICESPEIRLGVLLISLSRPSLTEHEARTLADVANELLHLASEPTARKLVFATARRHASRAPSIVHFLLRLLEVIPEESRIDRAGCLEVLSALGRLKCSALQDPGTLRELNLPTSDLKCDE